jgi:hypothetical protein
LEISRISAGGRCEIAEDSYSKKRCNQLNFINTLSNLLRTKSEIN